MKDEEREALPEVIASRERLRRARSRPPHEHTAAERKELKAALREHSEIMRRHLINKGERPDHMGRDRREWAESKEDIRDPDRPA